MADNKGYYYMRLKEDFFESDEMIVLQNMQDGYLYSDILMKMYLRSLKTDGRLMLKNLIPYNAPMLAQITRHQVGTVERALKIFEQLGLIEVLDNGAIYMRDIQLLVGKSSTEADRQREYYQRIQREKRGELPDEIRFCEESCKKSYKESCKESTPEIENRDKAKSKAITKSKIDSSKSTVTDEPKEKIPYQAILEAYTSTCKSLQKCTILSDKRKSAIKARFASGYTLEDFETVFQKAENSKFLKGGNDRDWRASFDWLIKDANMAKVLDGNYDDWKGDGTTDGRESGQKIVEGGGGHDFRPVSGIIQV